MSHVLMVLVISHGWIAPSTMASTAVRFPSLESCEAAASRLVARWQSPALDIRATCLEGPL